MATEIYRIAQEAVGGRGRIERVKVAVGELSAVEPDLLRFAWEALTSDGEAAGSTLEVEWRPAKQLCATCGEVAARAPGSWLRLCGTCGAPLRVSGGDELDVLQVSFDEKDAEGSS